jgi:hypothetical protein
MTRKEGYDGINYDGRLSLHLVFVCEILDVTPEDFATLAISNLLEEELDYIKNSLKHPEVEHIEESIRIVKAVKCEANGCVINKEKAANSVCEC